MGLRETWFGTRGYETWIPTPAINPDYSRVGFSATNQYVNGHAGHRESRTAHNVYVLSWSQAKSRDAIRAITDFADGVFDDQPDVNLIYWIDPMAADKNLLNQEWATPSLGCEDGIPLLSDSFGVSRPKPVPTPPNQLRYPARSAEFTLAADSHTMEQYIPLPPGYTVWVGVHGSPEAQGMIEIQPVIGRMEVGSAIEPTILAVTDQTRLNTAVDSTDARGIVLRFKAGATGTFVLSGLMVQVLRTGQVPAKGGFVSGQGNSGCQFIGKPSTTPYSAKLDRVGATARLEETGMAL